LDVLGHNPVVLAELPHALEALVFKHRQPAVVEEGGRDLSVGRVFWIALDQTTTQALNLGERAGKSRGRDALTPVLPVNEEASDSPIWRRTCAFAVDTQMLDAREFRRRSKLAPPYAGSSGEDKGRMRFTLAHTLFLSGSTMRSWILALSMKGQAPAAAPDAFVSLDEGSEVAPRGL